MKTKITKPKKVKVGPYNYRIDWVPEKFMADRGQCDKAFLWIRVKNGECPVIQQKVTLLHEIIHAAFGVTDFNYLTNSEEEDYIERISAVLYDALRNNPEVTSWLFNSVDD